jgi:hypothetical protein
MSGVANELKEHHIQVPFFIMTLTRYSAFFGFNTLHFSNPG